MSSSSVRIYLRTATMEKVDFGRQACSTTIYRDRYVHDAINWFLESMGLAAVPSDPRGIGGREASPGAPNPRTKISRRQMSAVDHAIATGRAAFASRRDFVSTAVIGYTDFVQATSKPGPTAEVVLESPRLASIGGELYFWSRIQTLLRTQPRHAFALFNVPYLDDCCGVHATAASREKGQSPELVVTKEAALQVNEQNGSAAMLETRIAEALANPAKAAAVARGAPSGLACDLILIGLKSDTSGSGEWMLTKAEAVPSQA